MTGPSGLQPQVTLTSAYNVLSERQSLSDSLGGAWTSGFDPVSRLAMVTAPGGATVALAYDGTGRPTAVTRSNGIDTAASYDLNGRLESLVHGPLAAPVKAFAYGYDALGNVTQIDEDGGALVRAYSYDALERLTAVTINGLPAESYSLDALGNRITSHLSASHTLDDANRLTEDDGFCYAYDLNGNLASKTAKLAGVCSGAVTGFTWDAQDQLIRIDLPAAVLPNTSTMPWAGGSKRTQAAR